MTQETLVRSQSVVARVVAGETLIVPVRGKVGDLASIYSLNGTASWTTRANLRTEPGTQALMVADKDDTENFSQDSLTVQAQLPTTMQVTDVFTGTVGTTVSRQDIINGINSGQLLVNYLGHGSEEQWSGSDIFDTNSVSSLANRAQLPVFLIMDCLNGFFQDVYAQPLGVTLLLAPHGGAVAVVASSGLSQPVPQTQWDVLVVGGAFHAPRPTLGEAILKAKQQISDADVRRTYVLLGDPAMRVKQPTTSSATH